MPQNKKYIIVERRSRVAEYYLKGTPQYKIADILKCSQSQVSRDLKQLSKKWLESSLMNIDEIKARELAKVDRAELEYWKGWERSMSIQTKKRVKKSDRAGGEHKEQSLEEIRSVGDPRFIDGVLRCIKQRSEILGIEAARKADVNLNTLSEQQLDTIIQEIINKSNQNENDEKGEN